MRQLSSRIASVVLGAALVVAGLEITSYAATGDPFVLGGSNTESRSASLTNTGRGPALSLHSGHGSPALSVGNAKKIAHLNADAVDGLSGSALETQAVTWTLAGDSPNSEYVLRGLKPGTYLATMDILMDWDSAAECEIDQDNGVDVTVSVLTYGANRVGTFSMASGSGIFKRIAGQKVTAFCEAPLDPTYDSTVTMVRLDHVVHATVTVPAARPAHGTTGPWGR